MRQLTAMDASFLYVEAGGTPGHTSGLIVVDPSTAPQPITAETIREYIAARIHLIPPLRWRLVEVPFGLDLPYWIDDPELDLEYHVNGTGLPRPGTDEQLSQLLARLASRPLDRSRPLWEVYVIDGMQSGHVGIFTKAHHAAMDGKSNMQMLATLLDLEPVGREIPPPKGPTGERVPRDVEMAGRAWLNALARPEVGVRLAVNMARESVGMGRKLTAKRDTGAIKAMTRTAPKTVFNQQLSKRRNCAFATLSLTTVRQVKSALGCTVNDVILAVCAGALRRHLLEHDGLPDESLLAMVPISIRAADAGGAAGNQVSATAAELATTSADPLEWVRVAHESMNAGKALNDAVPAALLQEFGQFTAPAAAEFVARTFANLKVVNRVAMPFNVVVSNVPGPRETLYYAGAEMVGLFPVSMVSDGVGLNITIISYRDDLDFGLISTPEIVPDIWTLMSYFQDALDEVAAAAGVTASPAGETSIASTEEAPAATAPARKRAAKRPASSAPAAKRATKKTARKPAAKKAPTTKAAAKKAATTTSAAAAEAPTAEEQTAPRAAKKAPTKKAPATKAPAKKAPAKRAAATRKTAKKATATKAVATAGEAAAAPPATGDGQGEPAREG